MSLPTIFDVRSELKTLLIMAHDAHHDGNVHSCEVGACPRILKLIIDLDGKKIVKDTPLSESIVQWWNNMTVGDRLPITSRICSQEWRARKMATCRYADIGRVVGNIALMNLKSHYRIHVKGDF